MTDFNEILEMMIEDEEFPTKNRSKAMARRKNHQRKDYNIYVEIKHSNKKHKRYYEEDFAEA